MLCRTDVRKRVSRICAWAGAANFFSLPSLLIFPSLFFSFLCCILLTPTPYEPFSAYVRCNCCWSTMNRWVSPRRRAAYFSFSHVNSVSHPCFPLLVSWLISLLISPLKKLYCSFRFLSLQEGRVRSLSPSLSFSFDYRAFIFSVFLTASKIALMLVAFMLFIIPFLPVARLRIFFFANLPPPPISFSTFRRETSSEHLLPDFLTFFNSPSSSGWNAFSAAFFVFVFKDPFLAYVLTAFSLFRE